MDSGCPWKVGVKKVRIGVVCEGPTDAHAICCFLGASLNSRGIDATFVGLQPEVDRTCAPGGWGMVFEWLKQNPPRARTLAYFDGGLFGSGLTAKQCDALLIQLDADNLSNESFRQRVRNSLGVAVREPTNPRDRGSAVRCIVELAGEFDELANAYRKLHVVAPSVESTETWCVGIFEQRDLDPELLQGESLCQEFMSVLHKSEKRPMQQFRHVNKSSKRRLRFCDKHAKGFARLEYQCQHYFEIVTALTSIGGRE